jgi:hypothetical protein
VFVFPPNFPDMEVFFTLALLGSPAFGERWGGRKQLSVRKPRAVQNVADITFRKGGIFPGFAMLLYESGRLKG